MQKSKSLKSRKFNIIIPKTAKYLENIPESNENYKITKIKKSLPPIPDLNLPIKKITYITNRKDKNKKINKISFEKLRQLVYEIRLNKKEKNHDKKVKNIIRIKKPINTSIKTHKNNKYNLKTINNKTNNNDINNNIREFNYNSENNQIIKINNNIEKDKNKSKERSNSVKTEINENLTLKNDLSQIRNDNKKWYDISYLKEKYNDLLLTTENLEKNLMDKYLNGKDNIISEIEEPDYLKEDSEINTININASLGKHLSIRETTLDTSYQGNSYYNYTTKIKGKTNGLIRRIKNYRQIFKKHRTNLTFKYYEKNKNKLNNYRYSKEKKRKKIFSLNKVNMHNISDNISIPDRLTNHKINNSGSSIIIKEKSRDSTYNKQKSVSVYKKRRNNENKSNIGQNNNNQFLSVINEANDLIKSDSKKGNFRPKLKNNQQENNLLSNKKKYNTKYIKNKLKKLQQSINNINTTNLNLSEKKRSLKNRYNTTYSSNYTNSSINEYEIGSDIGIGSYAEVKLGIHRKTKKKYAIKIYPKNLIDDEDKINSIKNEIYILNQLNHENIMKLYDLINTPKYLYLILEYINGISLLEYIHKSPNKRIEENFCKKIFYQIVKAIEYCTQKNIFHRDIKLENILLINNDSIKIIDFGFAIKCSKKEYQKFFCGTLYYMPPEIINKKKYLPYYSDIWSLGVLLYIMIYGRFPFNSNNEDDLFDLINEGKFEFPEDINSSDDVKNLIKKIIVVEPCKRATLSEIINDTWFKN